MKTLKLSNLLIVAALHAFQWLAGRTLKYPLSLHVSQNYATLERTVKEIGDEQEKLNQQYADREGEDKNAKPKKNEKGLYVIEERQTEYLTAMNDLMAQERTIRLYTFSAEDFNFQLPKPEGQETNKDIERKNFRDTVLPWVWAKMGPLLSDNVIEETEGEGE